MTFDIRYGSVVASDVTNLFHTRGADGSWLHFPSVWFRASRRKISVRYGPASFREVNQHPNPSAGHIMSVEITLLAGKLSMRIDGAVCSNTDNWHYIRCVFTVYRRCIYCECC